MRILICADSQVPEQGRVQRDAKYKWVCGRVHRRAVRELRKRVYPKRAHGRRRRHVRAMSGPLEDQDVGRLWRAYLRRCRRLHGHAERCRRL